MMNGLEFKTREIATTTSPFYTRHQQEHFGELKQARTETAVNKQLNFSVKNKPHTINYIYCIFETYFMIKSV